MSNVTKLPDHREAEARAAFGNYVQSIAFNLTLSRTMIDGLRIVRDFGYPAGYVREEDRPAGLETLRSPSGQCMWTTACQALIRRGLVFHDYIAPNQHPPAGHRYFKLTRAGELTCELLVEAGLLPAAVPVKRSKRA